MGQKDKQGRLLDEKDNNYNEMYRTCVKNGSGHREEGGTVTNPFKSSLYYKVRKNNVKEL